MKFVCIAVKNEDDNVNSLNYKIFLSVLLEFLRLVDLFEGIFFYYFFFKLYSAWFCLNEPHSLTFE